VLPPSTNSLFRVGLARAAALAAFALPRSAARSAQPGPRSPQRTLDALLGIVRGLGRGSGGSSRRGHWQQFVRVIRLILGGDGRRSACGLARCRIGRLRLFAVGDVAKIVAVVTIGLGDVAAHRLLMLAVVLPVLLMTMLLMAALLMAALLVATLAVAAMALLAALTLTTLTLATVTLAAMALAAVTLAALIAWVLAVALHPGVHALRVRSAGVIERRRQALAHVLHVHVGDRKLATAHARPLAVVHRAQHAIVMVGMLQEVLGSDAVAGRARVARELKILFEDLVGIAADPQLLPPAVVPLTLVWTTTTHSVGLARTAPAGASVVIVILFHV
jgi:hypothetical protein